MNFTANHPPVVYEPRNNRLRHEALEQLEKQITTLWGYLNAATYQFLVLVAEFDRNNAYERHGMANTAQWLNWWCSIGKGAAREKVRVARALERLPLISAGFKTGELSYSKVRAMTRVATPVNEEVLVNIARHGTATHVERLVKKYRWTQERDAARTANGQHLSRSVHYWNESDDTFALQARLPPEIGALVEKALQVAGKVLRESFEDEKHPNWQHDVSAGTWAMKDREHSYTARRADALKLIMETFLACRSEDLETISSADRYQVIVHIDQAVLTQTAPPCESEPHLTELDAGPAIALNTARRLACDGALVGMIDGEDGEPLSVGRKTRAIPPALQRALRARDGGCRFPGCGRTRFTHGHHIEHWADGGETKLSNLITLCSFHHRLVHEGGFGVVRTDDGAFIFTRPDGARIPECGPPPTPSTAEDGRSRGNAVPQRLPNGELDPDYFDKVLERYVQSVHPDAKIDSYTAACKWTGERMDYSTAIESMQWRESRYGAQNAGDSS